MFINILFIIPYIVYLFYWSLFHIHFYKSPNNLPSNFKNQPTLTRPNLLKDGRNLQSKLLEYQQ